jgi:hypothetical protein
VLNFTVVLATLCGPDAETTRTPSLAFSAPGPLFFLRGDFLNLAGELRHRTRRGAGNCYFIQEIVMGNSSCSGAGSNPLPLA